MRWAILSDIHGNLEAFRAVLDFLSTDHIDRVIFLGDIVGYGANPNECTDLLKDSADIIVAGNHDYGAVGLTDISNFNYVARAAIEWTAKHLSATNRIFLSGFSLTAVVDDVTFVHSTPRDPQNWDYLLSWNDVATNFKSYQNRICFIGHSHTPAIFTGDKEDKVYPSNALTIRLELQSRYIINVGSVGQPRDGIPDAAFGIYDSRESIFTLKRVPYDIPTTQRKITDAGLPEYLAARIAVGR
ncbi:MAG: metallophosphoesterase family protein [Pseudomonadota bacterium]